jgi:hypothetical protein
MEKIVPQAKRCFDNTRDINITIQYGIKQYTKSKENKETYELTS